MLFIIAILGAIGGVVLGLVGLARGDAGELERIFAIASFGMAAAGLVGRSAHAPSTARMRAKRLAISLEDFITAIAIAPVVVLCVGVFLLTLIPSVYVMLPVFAVWWLGSERRRGRHVEPTPAPGPMPEPAAV